MSDHATDSAPAHVFRVDKFVVPEEAIDEFLGYVERTHALLREQPGFEHELILRKDSGPGQYNIVTLVEWDGDDAIAGARDAVHAMNARDGFDPSALFERLGVTADLVNYRTADAIEPAVTG